MVMDLTLDVPEPFAESLFADELAGLPLHDRSGGGAAQTAIEVIGVVADTTSIVVAVAAFPEIARRLLAWVRGNDAQQDGRTYPTEIRISTPAGVVQVRVPQGADGVAIDVSVAEVRSVLEVAASEQVK
jgi:hypothetical protein